MNKATVENTIKNFPGIILPMVSSAAVLRKEKKLIYLLHLAIKLKIPTIKIYEALLQTYLFAGFPSALISLQIASKYLSFKKSFKANTKGYKKLGPDFCQLV